MLRAILVIATLLIFSAAPLDAEHKRHRNRGQVFVQFSIGGGHHHHQPNWVRGHYYQPRYYGNDYYRGRYYDDDDHGYGYYDSHRRYHKHKRFKHKRFKSRYYRDHYRCPYH